MGERRINATGAVNETSGIVIPLLSQQQFDFFSQFLLAKSGIRLTKDKMSLVSSRLAKILKQQGFQSWDQYIALLKAGAPEDLTTFINAMTTNKTDFFREKKHFDYIEQEYLGKWLEANKRPFYTWIAASSFGQEALTLAMTLDSAGAKRSNQFPFKILATDIDTNATEFADHGIYEGKIVEHDVKPEQIKKYFLKGTGSNSGKYKFNPEYAKNIKFRTHNLCDFSSRIPIEFDLIMLRNVLIYFDPQTVEKVITKCLSHLRPGGLLILGHCESIIDMKWDLETVSQSVYRKK